MNRITVIWTGHREIREVILYSRGWGKGRDGFLTVSWGVTLPLSRAFAGLRGLFSLWSGGVLKWAGFANMWGFPMDRGSRFGISCGSWLELPQGRCGLVWESLGGFLSFGCVGFRNFDFLAKYGGLNRNLVKFPIFTKIWPWVFCQEMGVGISRIQVKGLAGDNLGQLFKSWSVISPKLSIGEGRLFGL